MFLAPKNVEELRRLYDSDTPVLAYAFKRRMVEGWTPEHSHVRGQLIALTQGLVIVEAGSERWMFPYRSRLRQCKCLHGNVSDDAGNHTTDILSRQASVATR